MKQGVAISMCTDASQSSVSEKAWQHRSNVMICGPMVEDLAKLWAEGLFIVLGPFFLYFQQESLSCPQLHLMPVSLFPRLELIKLNRNVQDKSEVNNRNWNDSLPHFFWGCFFFQTIEWAQAPRYAHVGFINEWLRRNIHTFDRYNECTFCSSPLNLNPNTGVWYLNDKSDSKQSVDFVSLCRVTHYMVRQHAYGSCHRYAQEVMHTLIQKRREDFRLVLQLSYNIE